MKKEKRKIPRKALEPLMQMCEWKSKESGKPATEIFKEYLGLMTKYASYFFSKPWPKKYDYDEATAFADEDLEFLRNGEEFWERFETMCLKKNMYLEGFVGYFGMYWTEQTFYKEFIRPGLEPIVETFEKYVKIENARSVLNELKEHFKDVRLIHAGIIDLLEQGYLNQANGLLVARVLELMHTEENLLPCGKYQCKIQRELLHKK